MVETQPKLVLVGADARTAAELSALIGDRYEVVRQPEEPTLAAVLRALGEGVLITAGDSEPAWSNQDTLYTSLARSGRSTSGRAGWWPSCARWRRGRTRA